MSLLLQALKSKTHDLKWASFYWFTMQRLQSLCDRLIHVPMNANRMLVHEGLGLFRPQVDSAWVVSAAF